MVKKRVSLLLALCIIFSQFIPIISSQIVYSEEMESIEDEAINSELDYGERKEGVKDEELKDEELKDGELKDGELKDGELKDGELKDEELKDGEVKDEELKDGEVKDEELKDEEEVLVENKTEKNDKEADEEDSKKEIIVKFDLNYETNEKIENQVRSIEECIDEPVVEEREGYEFVGWFRLDESITDIEEPVELNDDKSFLEEANILDLLIDDKVSQEKEWIFEKTIKENYGDISNIPEEINLYAKWKIKKIKLDIEIDGKYKDLVVKKILCNEEEIDLNDENSWEFDIGSKITIDYEYNAKKRVRVLKNGETDKILEPEISDKNILEKIFSVKTENNIKEDSIDLELREITKLKLEYIVKLTFDANGGYYDKDKNIVEKHFYYPEGTAPRDTIRENVFKQQTKLYRDIKDIDEGYSYIPGGWVPRYQHWRIVDKDATFKSEWQLFDNLYVKFDLVLGNVLNLENPTTLTVPYSEDKIIEPTIDLTNIIDGFEFEGWYLDKEYKHKFDFEKDKASDYRSFFTNSGTWLELYAKWKTPEKYKVDIRYKTLGKDTHWDLGLPEFAYEHQNITTINSIQRNIIDKEKHIVRYYEIVNEDSQNVIASETGDDPINFKMPGNNIIINIDIVEKKEGVSKIKFLSEDGYFKDSKNSKEIELEVENGTTIDGNIIEEITNKIYKDVNSDDILVNYFEGWYTDIEKNNIMNFNMKITEDIILYPKFEEVKEVKIKFSSGIEKYINDLPKDQVLNLENKKIEKVDDLTSYTTKFDEFKFGGWILGELFGTEIWESENILLNNEKLIEKKNGEYILNVIGNWNIKDLFESGTENDPFELDDKETLEELGKRVNNGKSYEGCYYKLIQDIDLVDIKNWKPIGNKESPFKGIIDGEGYSIVNLNIEKTKDAGLFGYLENSKIKNLKIIDINMEKVNNTGGLAAKAKNCDIKGLEITGLIDGSDLLGGLIGVGEGKLLIEDIESKVNLSGTEKIGGVIGYINNKSTQNINISEVRNEGNISSIGRSKSNIAGMGGIIGYVELDKSNGSKNNLINIKNYGNIDSLGNGIGGIVGIIGNNYNLNNLENHGNIKSEGLRVGGIIGSSNFLGKDGLSYNLVINNSTNSGDIDGYATTAGIIGEAGIDTSILNCKNKGNIISNMGPVGGVLGISHGGKGDSQQLRLKAVKNVENFGSVNIKEHLGFAGSIGGVVGELGGGTSGLTEVEMCLNHGDVVSGGSNSNVGGVFGRITGGFHNQIKKCGNSGEIRHNGTNGSLGGIAGSVGDNNFLQDMYNVGPLVIESSNENNLLIGGIIGQWYFKIGMIEEDRISIDNAYNYFPVLSNEESVQISGNYPERNTNCYYLKDEKSKNDNFGDTIGLEETDFLNGKLAYLLDTNNKMIRTRNWSQGEKYPVFKSEKNNNVYKLNIRDNQYGVINNNIPEVYGNAKNKIEVSYREKEGYLLKNVKIKDNSGNLYKYEIKDNKIIFHMPHSNVEMSADFIKIPSKDEKVTVRFLDEDGKELGFKTIDKGARLPFIDEFDKDGYILLGWYLDNELFDFNTAITEDLILVAKWQKEDQVKVILDLNLSNDCESSNHFDPIIIQKGNKIEKPIDPDMRYKDEKKNNFMKFKFKGWTTEKNGDIYWDFENNVNQNMILYAKWEVVDAMMLGTEDDPFIISDVETLKELSDKLNKDVSYFGGYFKLGSDLEIPEDWNSIGYHPTKRPKFMIKRPEPEALPFEGVFDGGGHTITLNSEIKNNSLFGCIGFNGIVKNLKVESKLEPFDREHFGGIAKTNYGIIENCNVRLEGISDENVFKESCGGIVGANIGRVVGSSVYLHVNVKGEFIGGIAGFSNAGDYYRSIENCTLKEGSSIINNDSDISGVTSGNATGGIVGAMVSSGTEVSDMDGYYRIEGCKTEENILIKGNINIGGIVGYGAGHIINCENNANVEGGNRISGIIADLNSVLELELSNNINKGDIEGDSYVAGIMTSNQSSGASKTGKIEKCRNLGNIKSRDSVAAGLTTSNVVLVIDSYNIGNIEGNTKAAGLVSGNVRVMKNSYSFSDISGEKINIFAENVVNFDNNYYGFLSEQIEHASEYGEKKSTEAFRSGEVSFLLDKNNRKTDKKWTLSEELNVPVLGKPNYSKTIFDISGDTEGLKSIIIDEKLVINDSIYRPIGDEFQIELELQSNIRDDNDNKYYNYEIELMKYNDKIIENKSFMTINDFENELIVKIKKIEKQKVEEEPSDTDIEDDSENIPSIPEEKKDDGDNNNIKLGETESDGNESLNDGTGNNEGNDGLGNDEGGDGIGENEGNAGIGNNENSDGSKGKSDLEEGENITVTSNSSQETKIDIKSLVADSKSEISEDNIVDKPEESEVKDENENKSELDKDFSDDDKQKNENKESPEKISLVNNVIEKMKSNPIMLYTLIVFIVGNVIFATVRFIGLKRRKNKKD